MNIHQIQYAISGARWSVARGCAFPSPASFQWRCLRACRNCVRLIFGAGEHLGPRRSGRRHRELSPTVRQREEAICEAQEGEDASKVFRYPPADPHSLRSPQGRSIAALSSNGAAPPPSWPSGGDRVLCQRAAAGVRVWWQSPSSSPGNRNMLYYSKLQCWPEAAMARIIFRRLTEQTPGRTDLNFADPLQEEMAFTKRR